MIEKMGKGEDAISVHEIDMLTDISNLLRDIIYAVITRQVDIKSKDDLEKYMLKNAVKIAAIIRDKDNGFPNDEDRDRLRTPD
jgi:hypothetical protein